ncbi:YjjG family noncanonical pyrimidine nucleotidase [Pedobacter sandarakinus]|uniref:YjjG family noncanonical pyrimidine nucleotidase n=1 Tax=Pedobacter sandarakinus TaxID=353156 RepID=UPI002246F64F|nr:YjjG family noncanonical pyrimidine nucleotidase [Pedobacter sandarakinus]MCX2573970.1 YjjG family noncanonical pyrimidine nucleotidase [Pedobacter sandarakinus]
MHHHKKHIFFDLDHTIWDFDRNAEETLNELYDTHKLATLGVTSCADFIATYTENNHQLWADYHLGKITKDFLRSQRFSKTFIALGVHPDAVPHQFEDDYVRISPTKTNLFEDAEMVLAYLQKKYTLHIISNGFKETTLTKMDLSKLNPYFQNVIISEDVGVNKPSPIIFEYALDRAKTTKPDSIMIGDSLEADIYGALNFGMEAIFFNPMEKEKPADVKHEIKHLKDLLTRF